jgi:hypothetical protein
VRISHHVYNSIIFEAQRAETSKDRLQGSLSDETKKNLMIDVCPQTTRPESGTQATCTLASTHGDGATEALCGPNAFITKGYGRE